MEGAAGNSKATARNHGHTETQAGEQRRQRERNFVAYAAGGMFIDERARIGGKSEQVSGIAHGEGQSGHFLRIEAAKENGHQESGYLIVWNPACCVSVDYGFDLVRGQWLPVAFCFKEGQEIHRAKFSKR